jgi:nucleoid DNA-binding protein
MEALKEFGEEMAQAVDVAVATSATTVERFELFWTRVIDSFRDNREVWLATFDTFSVAQRDPDMRAAVAEGLERGRLLWARLLSGHGAGADGPSDGGPSDDPIAEREARAVGSLHQGLISGILVQWLIDAERAPSAADLTHALQAVARLVEEDRSG